MMRSLLHWTITGFIAVGIHIGVLVALSSFAPAPVPGADEAGAGGIEIGLGHKGSSYVAALVAPPQPEVSEPPAPAPRVQRPPRHARKARPNVSGSPKPRSSPKQRISRRQQKPKPRIPARPMPRLSTKRLAKVSPEPEQAVTTAIKPPPTKVPEPVRENAPEKKSVETQLPVAVDRADARVPSERADARVPSERADARTERLAAASAPSAVAEVVTEQPASARSPASAEIAMTGEARQNSTGGKPGDSSLYFSKVLAELNRHKRYPVRSKRRKEEGVVTVALAIARNGSVVATDIRSSSGFPGLDKAAIELLRDASPLPAVPDSLNHIPLEIVIPIEYSLITNSH